MTESREAEYSRLAGQAEEIEKLIKSGARQDAGYLLTAFLENVRSRMDTIRFDETLVQQEQKERKEKETAAVTVLVEREQSLNSTEKEQYGEFLKQDYFTKSNFGDLEEFYAKTWDKLSDGGKNEMSHRVWEGIRHDEYSFDELPEGLRKKEAEHLYDQVRGKTEADPGLKNIPQHDLDDFIREQEAANETAVTEVLSRKAFSENVSSRKESVNLGDSRAEVKKSNNPADRDIQAEAGPLSKISIVQETDEVTVPQMRVTAAPTPGFTKGG